ncbi:hypothetical protein [Sphingomonas crusticola]|uniref:hypothetical protein n=1 Tax=Sphingomonas crusticola TaxID=1697973 RepID=UPI000E250BDF|nr:hypothetical protein [Sphingomonas crusticola]
MRRWIAYSEPPQHYERGSYAQNYWAGIARDLDFPADSVDFCRKIADIVSRSRARATQDPPAEKIRPAALDHVHNAVQHYEFVTSKGYRGLKLPRHP